MLYVSTRIAYPATNVRTFSIMREPHVSRTSVPIRDRGILAVRALESLYIPIPGDLFGNALRARYSHVKRTRFSSDSSGHKASWNCRNYSGPVLTYRAPRPRSRRTSVGQHLGQVYLSLPSLELSRLASDKPGAPDKRGSPSQLSLSRTEFSLVPLALTLRLLVLRRLSLPGGLSLEAARELAVLLWPLLSLVRASRR